MNIEEPVLFIDIVNDANGKQIFRLTPTGEDLLVKLSDKIISVVAIAGPQRTGKSFLSNMLVNKMEGFSIGSSTLPCTKGIWIWGAPRIIDDQAILILDTEGLHSVFRDKKVDAGILGITIFGIIDEKELNEISSVIELTKWVKDGNIIPYFLWCLRDFVLDYNKIENTSDDYMENILGTKDYPQESEKYKIRKSFSDFFKDRGCLVFVRPVNEESKLRTIEKLAYNQLRPEFRKSVEEFKSRVQFYLKPKRFNNKVINGTGFARLIQDILESFNSNKVPEIVSSVERIIKGERKDVVSKLKEKMQKFLVDNKDDKDLLRKGILYLWNEIYDIASKKHDLELPSEIFLDLVKFFLQKYDQEKGGQLSKSEKELENIINKICGEDVFEPDKVLETLYKQFDEKKLRDGSYGGTFLLDSVLKRLLKKAGLNIIFLKKQYTDQIEEKQKDIEAENQKKNNLNAVLNQHKKEIFEYQKKIDVLKTQVRSKDSEITTIKESGDSDRVLLNQLSILEAKVSELETENQNLKKGKGGMNNLKNSMLLDQIGNLTGADSTEIKEFFENLKEEVLKENTYLSEKVGQLMEENKMMKSQSVDSNTNMAELEDARNKLKQLQNEKKVHTDWETDRAILLSENKRLKASKIDFFYLLKETIKGARKQNNQLKNAVGILGDEDSIEAKKILDEMKCTYK